MGYELGLLDSRTAFDCNSELVGACVTLGLSPRDQTFLQEPLEAAGGGREPCAVAERMDRLIVLAAAGLTVFDPNYLA